MDICGHLLHDADNEAAQKIAALVFGARSSKPVAGTTTQAVGASNVLKDMEAGVGIEPAYTDLQSAA